jgi:hypothetical protein
MKRNFETVSLPLGAKSQLREIADREHRSMAQQICHWIESDFNQKQEARNAK